MRWSRLGLLSAVVTLLTFLCACGGGSSSGSSGIGSTPDFMLAVSNSPQTVVAGASTTYTVTLTATNGFTGTVTPPATGLPSGATASFSAIASGSSTLTVTTTTATAAATSTLTVTGTSGTLSHTGTASLVVTPAPDLSIALSFASSVVAGVAGTYAVTVTALHGFTGTVTLSGTSLPTGVNGWFLPPTVAGAGTSVMNLVTPATLTASTYSFSVSGISNGVTHTASSSLSVTAATR